MGGRVRTETRALFVNAGHWLTRCNVSQMVLDSLDILRDSATVRAGY